MRQEEQIMGFGITPPVIILADGPGRQHHYKDVLSDLELKLIDGKEEALCHNPDLVIVTDEWYSECAVLVAESHRRWIPS